MEPGDMRDVGRDIAAAQLPLHTVAMWWLGQASIVLRGVGTTVYVDPFLSEYPDRLVPPPFAPAMAPLADDVLCTHEHVDHFDPQTLPGLAQASPHALFVVPLPIVEQARALGISSERILGNMDEREAADLAAAAGVKILVPIHYEMFAANQGRPGTMVEYIQANHSELACLVPAHGRRFTFMKGDGC